MAAVAYAEGHYHNTIGSIGRGTGYAPIVAKAAYRAGECLFDERTGQWHDYRYKADRVIEKFIMVREGAAAWGLDRNRLWNASEAAEPRKNGRNATELELALPHALTDEQRHDMLSAYVREKVEKYGIAADVAVHYGRDGNIHAHVVLSHRQFGAEGFGEPCNAHTVMKKRKGQWKQETVYGISCNPDAVKELRREWAEFQNAWFEKLGLDVRVDHRSFDERGIKQTPTVHLGPNAAALEARGIRTDRGDINRMIEVGNAELHRLEAEAQRQDAEIIDFRKAKAEREAPPRNGEAEKNYSKRDHDEITAEKDQAMKTPDSADLETDELEQRKRESLASFRPSEPPPDRYDQLNAPTSNQNDREPHRMAVGESVPVTFGPETIAASSPESLARAAAATHEDATDPKTIRRQIDDQQDLAARAKEQTELSERFIAALQRDHEAGEKLKEAEQWAGQKVGQGDDITDARRRYLEAAEHFDIRRPYASLSEIAGIEGAAFQREQERLKQDAAKELDPDKRELIDLRRQIEANDYMAITSERLSQMSKIITGNSNSEESQRQAERAEYFAAQALELRQQRQEVQERIERQEQERETQRIDQNIEMARRFNEGRSSPSERTATAAATEQDNRGEAEGWRSVEPGEVLQPGAHVRMDLQTGQSQVSDGPRDQMEERHRDGQTEERARFDAAQTAPEAVETREATAASSVTGQPERLAVAPERPAETEPERENTDARQLESNIAANLEVTDAKAAKKAAIAQARGEIEASIEQGQDRGYGHSR